MVTRYTNRISIKYICIYHIDETLPLFKKNIAGTSKKTAKMDSNTVKTTFKENNKCKTLKFLNQIKTVMFLCIYSYVFV